MHVSRADRFWAKVERVGECAIWTAAKNRPDGYGVFRDGDRQVRATHVALEMAGRPVPKGMRVRATCGHTACVEVAHLEVFPARRRAPKPPSARRVPRGENSHLHRLLEADVEEVRRLAAEGDAYREIAERLGITRDHVGAIVRGQSWAHTFEAKEEEGDHRE